MSQRVGPSRALCATTSKPFSCYVRKTPCTSPGITSAPYCLPSTSRMTNSSTLLLNTSDTISSKNDWLHPKQGKVNKWKSNEGRRACVQFLKKHRERRKKRNRNARALARNNDQRVAMSSNYGSIIRTVAFLCLLFHAFKLNLISLKNMLRIVILFYLTL